MKVEISEAIREDVGQALEAWMDSAESMYKFGDYDKEEFDHIKNRIDAIYQAVVVDKL